VTSASISCAGRRRAQSFAYPFAAEERDPVQERVRLVQHLIELEHDPDRLVLGAALAK
jgi:hypothetical protein